MWNNPTAIYHDASDFKKMMCPKQHVLNYPTPASLGGMCCLEGDEKDNWRQEGGIPIRHGKDLVMHSSLLCRLEDVFLRRTQATIQDVVVDGVIEQRQILQHQQSRMSVLCRTFS